MIKTSNSKCRQYVANCQEFQAHQLYGVYEKGGYVVYSYGQHFPMFLYQNNQWYENSDKYSQTTSRQQGQARPFVDNIIKLPTKALQALIND